MAAFVIALSTIAASVCPRFDAKAELLAIHEDARRAHLTGDAALLARSAGDKIVFADGGTLRTQSQAQVRQFFTAYFQRVRYREWRDVTPPIVTVSSDGQVGWMAVEVEAKYLRSDKPEEGEKRFKSSWIATYQRAGCQWRMTGMASNVVDP